MPAPDGFSWVEKPLLAGMARPTSLEELTWLRDQGVQLLISLSENSLPRRLVNEAGLLHVHIPVEDLHPPTPEQIDQCVSTIQKAHTQEMGVGIHCAAGLGRTGTLLACYFVSKGLSAKNAIARVRRMRPGSVETPDQERAVNDYATRLGV